MDAVKLYLQLYSYLENKTPFSFDCGKICKKACCKSEYDDAGMYLFPREREVYTNLPKWARIEKSDFCYDGECVDIFICNGTCSRDLRPLACRIFPLTPYVKDGKLDVIIDPRGKGICPLANVSDEFCYAVKKIC